MQLRSSLASRLGLTMALLIASAALSGCGQKGPLTLPKPPAGPASAPAPATAPAPTPGSTK